MREIKFRAWDKDEKCWIPSKQLAVTADGELITYDEGASDYVETECFVKDPIEVIFMQYTGLKDKNGVEVYDGDIVKVIEKLYSNSEFIGEVHITLDGTLVFGVVEDGKMSNDWGHLSQFDCEVIGNIYENSELLK